MGQPSSKDEMTVRHQFDRLCQMALKGEGKRFWFNQNSLDFWLNRKYNDYEMDGGVYCG